ncbi:hypothetical protein IJ425_08100 [bacterium]|nr:hypothetical protein [bacterium]
MEEKAKLLIFPFLLLVVLIVCTMISDADSSKKEAMEIRYIMQKGIDNVSETERQRVESYILELAEIKTRGCAESAKILETKCRNIDEFGKIVFGEQGYKDFVSTLKNR